MAEAIVTDPAVTSNAPALPSFVFEGHNIRTVKDDFFPWFVAKDVAAALGLTWTSHTLDNVPGDWQRVVKVTTLRRGPQPAKIISEPAVYKLAFRSNKPEADRFTNWIASEVIPAIRRTGQYQAAQAQPVIPSTVSDRKPLERICNLLVDLKYKPAPVKKDYAKVRADVSKYMGVEKWEDLAAEDIPRAVAFVQTQIDALAIEGEPQKALPPGSDTVTLRDYARFYGNLPETAETWDRLEHRACAAYEAFRDEVLAIHKAAYAPFHERRVSNVGNFFDEVITPSREMMRTAGENAHLALRALTDGIHGMAAAWRLLVKG